MEIAGVELETLEFDSIGSWPPFFKKGVILAACAVTFLSGYVFYLNEKISDYINISSQTSSLYSTFVDTQQKVANLENYKKEVTVVETELEKLTEQLPQSNEDAGLLEDISQQAASQRLQFVSIKPGVSESKGFYKENPIELTLSGEYNGLGEFVSNISNMPRIVTFHNFEMKRNTSEGRGSLMMVVQAKTYWAITRGREK